MIIYMIVVSSEKKDIMSILWIAYESTIRIERERLEKEKGIADNVTVNGDGDGIKLDYKKENERVYVIKT